jgi:hypothetical protein
MKGSSRVLRGFAVVIVAASAAPVAQATWDSAATANARQLLIAPAPRIVLAPRAGADGFDWGDAAIGAGVVAGAIALLGAAGGAFVVRRRHADVLPEQSGVAPV